MKGSMVGSHLHQETRLKMENDETPDGAKTIQQIHAVDFRKGDVVVGRGEVLKRHIGFGYVLVVFTDGEILQYHDEGTDRVIR